MNKKQTKEYVHDTEVIDFITQKSERVSPSKASLQLLLKNMRDPQPSPYVSKRSYFYVFQKSFAIAFMALLVFSGGAVYLTHRNTESVQTSTNSQVQPTTSVSDPTDVSDAGISNDMAAVDAQLNGLDADNQNIY